MQQLGRTALREVKARLQLEDRHCELGTGLGPTLVDETLLRLDIIGCPLARRSISPWCARARLRVGPGVP